MRTRLSRSQIEDSLTANLLLPSTSSGNTLRIVSPGPGDMRPTQGSAAQIAQSTAETHTGSRSFAPQTDLSHEPNMDNTGNRDVDNNLAPSSNCLSSGPLLVRVLAPSLAVGNSNITAVAHGFAAQRQLVTRNEGNANVIETRRRILPCLFDDSDEDANPAMATLPNSLGPGFAVGTGTVFTDRVEERQAPRVQGTRGRRVRGTRGRHASNPLSERGRGSRGGSRGGRGGRGSRGEVEGLGDETVGRKPQQGGGKELWRIRTSLRRRHFSTM